MPAPDDDEDVDADAADEGLTWAEQADRLRPDPRTRLARRLGAVPGLGLLVALEGRARRRRDG